VGQKVESRVRPFAIGAACRSRRPSERGNGACCDRNLPNRAIAHVGNEEAAGSVNN